MHTDTDFEEIFTTDPQSTLVHVTGWGVLGAMSETVLDILPPSGYRGCLRGPAYQVELV